MDRELVERAQKGDLGAFEALASASHARLYRVAFGILRDSDRAKDAAQDALVDIWKHLQGVRDPGAYEAWSNRVVVRACMREVRQRPRFLHHPLAEVELEPRTAGAIAVVLDRDQLERGFRRLSVEHRAVIVMRYLLDQSYEDIAAVLEVSPGTVGSRLNRAMAALRAALEADERPTLPKLEPQEID
jgi:RNA polymerase sigma-70 factor, ECF subfamily